MVFVCIKSMYISMQIKYCTDDSLNCGSGQCACVFVKGESPSDKSARWGDRHFPVKITTYLYVQWVFNCYVNYSKSTTVSNGWGYWLLMWSSETARRRE